MASIQYPYREGLEKERQYSAELAMSGQAKALQYAFFAERSSQKVRGQVKR